MSRTNKQHYVPQFLLRNFALGGAGDDIACYRISDARFVPRVGTKNVAHENHFYGLQNVEKALGGIESLASRAIRQAIETASLPAFRSHEHHAILLFALLQSSRTPRAAEVTQERFDEVAKTVVSNMPELSEYHSRLDDYFFRLDNAPSESARLGLLSYPVLLDLRFKLLCNRTAVPFIISDHPAVQYNQFLEGRATLKGATGLASCGFQLFLPLSPVHQLIFYDPDVYRVGYRKLTNQTVEVTSDRDVRDLNMLQAVAASEALFFNHLFSEADASSPLKKAQLFGAGARRREIHAPGVAVMALGRRRTSQQGELFLTSADLPQSPGHAFYDRLNVAEAEFDRFVEDLCRPHYADEVGRPSLPPGTYFRMLFVGYFEGLDSQRGIAWRCADSFSLRAFLAVPFNETSPDHSSLTKIRQRLPEVVHEQVFARVLKLAHEKDVLRGKTVGVDSTTLEANAAMRAIVRKDTGEDYKTYLKRLATEAGMDNPTDEDLRRFDRKRPKKGSNKEWESGTDGDSRIAKMKDGRTHLAYKAEHAVDLDSGLVLAAAVHPADQGDAATLVDSLLRTQVNLVRADVDVDVEEGVADKGYHKAETLAECAAWGVRTYIPEPKRKKRTWTDKPESWRVATAANRRRVKGARSKRLQKKRSELVERSFAHVCETGGGRRTWLRGRTNVSKRYQIQVAAHNLGVVMRVLFGVGKPRVLQGGGGAALAALVLLVGVLIGWVSRW